jgi:hypothetical protein
MVHLWGVDGEEVAVYYFKCDNCGDIYDRGGGQWRDKRRTITKETRTIKGLVF